MSSVGKYEDKKDLVVSLSAQGCTRQEISSQTGIPLGSIGHYLRKWDVQDRKRDKYERLRAEILSLAENGVSQAKIAERFSISAGTINYLLQKWDFQKKKSKHADKREEVRRLLEEGKTITQIASETGIPLGSMGYLLAKWDFLDLEQSKTTGSHLTEEGRRSISESMKDRHKAGFKKGKDHHFSGLCKVRGSWAPEKEAREELERYVKADLTLADMSEAMGVDQKTITNWLRRFGLQQGIRSGERCSWYHGGWRKGRGPDWGEIRERILNRDGYKCRLCGMSQEEAKDRGHTLSIHHIVPWEVSHDNSDDNLITLCQSCHMKEEWRSGVWSADYTPLHV